MESLFDASFFDVSPTTPVEKASKIIGQLDIFGNVVELGDVKPEPEAAGVGEEATEETNEVVKPEVDPLEAAELAGELPGAPIEADDVDEAEAQALGIAIERDPGDVLNDPTWEPDEPIDLEALGDLDDIVVSFDLDESDESHESVEPTLVVDKQVAETVGADGRRNRSVDGIWELVIGQESTVETLRSAAQQPVHAYLFVGPPGAGKVRAALAFAASVLCPRGGCGECDICSRTLNQTHPDLLNVEREGASISVEQAREIIRLALRSPVEGSRKVLVLK